MVHYFGINYSKGAIGDNLIDVRCDKCDLEFQYGLKRVGRGSSTAHYGIGRKGAEQLAEDRSQEQLVERLCEEGELVPCPSCYWINEEQINGYRQTRFRWVKPIAISIFFFGPIASFFAAWFLYTGAKLDRWMAPYALIGGPLVSLAIFFLLAWFRSIAAKSIQPNRNYPDFPKVPPCTPLPIIQDPSTGEFKQVLDERIYVPDTKKGVLFVYQDLEFPPNCCYCCRPANKTFEQGYGWNQFKLHVPVCDGCHDRKNSAELWTFGITYFGFLFVAAVWLYFNSPDLLGFIVGFVFSVIVGLACPLVAAFIYSPLSLRIRMVDYARGVFRAYFPSEKYEQVVQKMNP